MKYLRLLEIQPGGWLLLSLLFFFGDLELLVVILGCVAVHEAGHLMALEHFRIRVRSITLDLTGLCICCNDRFMSRGVQILTAAAGPALGLAVGILASVLGNIFRWESLALFAGGNVVLAAFNLLPAKPLDGWRMLHAVFPRVVQVVSGCTALLVMCVGLYVMRKGYGTALALFGVILLLQDVAPDRRRPRLPTG